MKDDSSDHPAAPHPRKGKRGSAGDMSPQDVAGDVCDYPLARNLVLLVVAVASEVIVRFALTGIRQDFSVTLRDFAISPVES